MSPFLSTALIPIDHCAKKCASRAGGLYVRNVMWKAASDKRMFQSGMFRGACTVKEECNHGDKMSNQFIVDAHFMEKKAELMCAGYAFRECFPDSFRFTQKL